MFKLTLQTAQTQGALSSFSKIAQTGALLALWLIIGSPEGLSKEVCLCSGTDWLKAHLPDVPTTTQQMSREGFLSKLGTGYGGVSSVCWCGEMFSRMRTKGNRSCLTAGDVSFKTKMHPMKCAFYFVCAMNRCRKLTWLTGSSVVHISFCQ